MAREDLEPWVEIELAMTVLNFCLGKNGRKNGFAFFKFINSTNLQNFYILIQTRALSVAVRLNRPICLSQSLAKQRHVPWGQEIDSSDFFPVSNEFSTLKKEWDGKIVKCLHALLPPEPLWGLMIKRTALRLSEKHWATTSKHLEEASTMPQSCQALR